MRLDLLEEIADLLESDRVPEERFNMRFWGRNTECGTAGCAIGWATMLLPSWQGWKLEDPDEEGELSLVTPGNEDEWDDLEEKLELREDKDFLTVYHLFACERYLQEFPNGPTKHDVAARIRAFIAANRPASAVIAEGETPWPKLLTWERAEVPA